MRLIKFFSILLFANISFAQEANVFIDLGIKKYCGKINELDRSKFFGIQSSFFNSDLANEAPYLVNDLNVHFAKDYNGPTLAKELKDLSSSQVGSVAKEFAEKNKKNLGFKNNTWVLTQKAENVYSKNTDFDKEAVSYTHLTLPTKRIV